LLSLPSHKESPLSAPFEQEMAHRLAEIQSASLLRSLRQVQTTQGREIMVTGKTLLNFSSNDYLGLANHDVLKEAAIGAVEHFGTGSGASRLISGSLDPHHRLEQTLAQWKGAKAALVFSSGYATALGTICALVGRNDIVILDKLVHASIVDAARLSGATLRIFDHNNADDLEEILKWSLTRRDTGHVLIVTESVFSMDGDLAPLPRIVELKNQYAAWLMVDEAHACGLFGTRLSGRVEAEGLQGQVEIQMGTLGKALGSSGGFVAGNRPLIEFLLNKARSFIFSTAPAPASSAAAEAAVRLVQREEGKELARALWERVNQFGTEMKLQVPPASPIIPLMIGPEERALEVARELQDKGFFIPPVRYPTVAKGKARLRVSLSAAHQRADIEKLAEALRSIQITTM
jgi:8-amino-7-oxononanoate synthase